MRFFVLLLAALFFVQPAQAATFADGKAAYDKQDWKGAIDNLRPLAEEGDDRSLVLLGNMYADGYGVVKDEYEAFVLYRRAAILNNADGMLATAVMYRDGIGVPVNTRLAIAWLERSAKLGHQTGAFFHAMDMYQGSKGEKYDLKPDAVEAYKWFRLAYLRGSNDGIKKAAQNLADAVAKNLTPEQILQGDRGVVDFKPIDPKDLGDIPDAPESGVVKNTPESGVKN